MPSIPIDRNSVSIPHNLFLADLNFQTPAEAEVYIFTQAGKILIQNLSAVFQETEFGWVVAGTFKNKRALLWDLSSTRIASTRSKEEQTCKTFYVETTHRDESGRYFIQLPFNKKIFDL